MRRKEHKKRAIRNSGRVVTGILVGSVIGATVGLLMAPTSGEETRRRIKDEAIGAQERLKAAADNIESRARELTEEVSETVGNVKKSLADPKRATSTRS